MTTKVMGAVRVSVYTNGSTWGEETKIYPLDPSSQSVDALSLYCRDSFNWKATR